MLRHTPMRHRMLAKVAKGWIGYEKRTKGTGMFTGWRSFDSLPASEQTSLHGLLNAGAIRADVNGDSEWRQRLVRVADDASANLLAQWTGQHGDPLAKL